MYDATLVAAVKRFQTRHGLEPDGRLGKGTLAQLNTPLSFRVRQLELALERWRRLSLRSLAPGDRAESSRIPIARLRYRTPARARNEDRDREGARTADPAFVLGSRYGPVPALLECAHSAFNARSWCRTSNEIPPTSRRTISSWSRRKGKWSRRMRSQTRCWRNFAPAQLHLRQRRGPKNSLGLVKFVFPNEYDVYMHDTPAKSLFSRARRDFSHGCIRLEKAQNLAEWVLRDESGWRQDRIVAAMQGTESISVKLDAPDSGDDDLCDRRGSGERRGSTFSTTSTAKTRPSKRNWPKQGRTFRLPVANPAHVHVNEVRSRIISHAAAPERQRRVPKLQS